MRYFDLQVNGYAGVDFNSIALTTEEAKQACRLAFSEVSRWLGSTSRSAAIMLRSGLPTLLLTAAYLPERMRWCNCCSETPLKATRLWSIS